MTIQRDVETPALRVNVYEHGHLVTRVPCESLDDAADIAAQWDDVEGARCEVEDLGARHEPDDVLAPEPGDVLVDPEYRNGA